MHIEHLLCLDLDFVPETLHLSNAAYKEMIAVPQDSYKFALYWGNYSKARECAEFHYLAITPTDMYISTADSLARWRHYPLSPDCTGVVMFYTKAVNREYPLRCTD